MPSRHTLDVGKSAGPTVSSKNNGKFSDRSANVSGDQENPTFFQGFHITETFHVQVRFFSGSSLEDLTSRAHSPNSSSPVFGKKTSWVLTLEKMQRK